MRAQPRPEHQRRAQHREQDQGTRELTADPRAPVRGRDRRGHQQGHRDAGEDDRGPGGGSRRHHGSISAESSSMAGPGTREPSGSKLTPVRTSTLPSGDRVDHADLVDPTLPVAPAPEVDDDVHRRVQLAVRRLPGEAGSQRETLDPARHVTGRVGVHRRAATLVAGVHRREHVHHLGTAHLADDEPVRSHPQRLPHQRPQRDLAGALDVGGSRLEGDHVRVVGTQLRGVLDQDQSLVGADQREQGVQQRRLARAGAAADQERQPALHHQLQQRRALGGHGTGRHQLRQGEHPLPRHPQREHGAGPRDRREHGVEAGAVRQPQVDVRRGVVEPPTAGGREPLRQPAHGPVVGETRCRSVRARLRGRSTPGRRR